MRLELDTLGRIKNYIHAGQGVVLTLAFFMTIAIFTRGGRSDGRVGWYFGLCWLTIPILVYLVMVPMWSRAQRFSNVYAFATLDSVSVVLWLSAWASVASYVVEGKGNGNKKGVYGCDNFKFGSPGRCKLSEGVIVLGVFITLAFVATAFISFRSVMHYRRTGIMPGPMGKPNDFSTQTQGDFSTNMHNDDLDDEGQTDARQSGYGYQKASVDDEYAPIQHGDDEDMGHMRPTQAAGPLGQHGLGIHDYDTSYAGAGRDYGHNEQYQR